MDLERLEYLKIILFFQNFEGWNPLFYHNLFESFFKRSCQDLEKSLLKFRNSRYQHYFQRLWNIKHFRSSSHYSFWSLILGTLGNLHAFVWYKSLFLTILGSFFACPQPQHIPYLSATACHGPTILPSGLSAASSISQLFPLSPNHAPICVLLCLCSSRPEHFRISNGQSEVKLLAFLALMDFEVKKVKFKDFDQKWPYSLTKSWLFRALAWF